MAREVRWTKTEVKGRWVVTYGFFEERPVELPLEVIKYGFYCNIAYLVILFSAASNNSVSKWVDSVITTYLPVLIELSDKKASTHTAFIYTFAGWPTMIGVILAIGYFLYTIIYNLFFYRCTLGRELLVDVNRREAETKLLEEKKAKERQARAEQERWQHQEAARRKQAAIEDEKERRRQAVLAQERREREHIEGRKSALRKISLSKGRVDPREPLMFLFDTPFVLVDSPFMEVQAAGLARANVASQATVGNDQTIYRTGDGPKSTTVIPAPIPYRGISFVGDRTKLTLNKKVLVVQPYQMTWTQSGDMCSLVIGRGGDVLYAYNHVRHEEEYRCSEIERVAVDKLKPELMALFRKYMEGGSSSLPGSDGYA